MRNKIWIIAAVVLSLGACQTTGSGIKLPDDSELTYYLHKPPGKGPYPAVIVLHTIGGLRDFEIEYARELSKENFVTIAIDWKSGGGWLSHKVGAAYDFLQKLPKVDPQRIAIIGFSRGALEGTRVAIDFQNEYPIRPLRALVAYYIGRGVDGPSSDLPPILFLHGDKDIETGTQAVVTMCDQLKQMGNVCEAKIYENTQHAFTHSTRYGGYDGQASADAYKRAVTFLNKHLRKASIQ